MELLDSVKLPKYVYEDGKPRQNVWDTSSLSSFLACPRLYNLTNLNGYKMKSYGTVTGFGSAVHDGFEILDTGKFNNESKEQSVNKAIKYVLENYGEDLQSAEDKARGLEAALRAIVWRAEEYWDDTIGIAKMPDGAPCLETRFEVPFGKHRFSGRIDKIVLFAGELYLCDTKTTKAALSEQYFKMYRPNNQVYAYLWAAREIMKLPVKGFIIEAVQTGANFCRFNRTVFNVSKSSVDEWYMDAQYSLSVADSFWDAGYYPANFTACGNYGGCKFREVCGESPEHRTTLLNEDFDRQVHESLHKKGELIHAEDLFKKQEKHDRTNED